MTSFFLLLVRRIPALAIGAAVFVVVGVQLAVRPDQWLGSYHLAAAAICRASPLAAGAVGALAAAGAVVRGRRDLRALDQLSARPLARVEAVRFMACLASLTIAMGVLIAITYGLSSFATPGSRVGGGLLVAAWANLVIIAAIGFGLGRLVPHVALPPVIFVAGTLLIGYGSGSGRYSLPGYHALFEQDPTWRAVLAQCLFGAAMSIGVLLIGHLRVRARWRSVTRISTPLLAVIIVPVVAVMVLASGKIFPTSSDRVLANSDPAPACQSRETIEVCVWDDRKEYLDSYVTLLLRTRQALRMSREEPTRYLEVGLDQIPMNGTKGIRVAAGAINVDSVSPASFGLEFAAQNLAVNWPKVADVCGNTIKLDAARLTALLVEASKHEIDDGKWRQNLGLDRACP